MKKILSAALAALMAISALTTTAFADDPTPLAGSNSVKAEGSVGVPALKITMPKSMAFVFNPYKLKLTDKGKIDAENGIEQYIVGAFTNEAKDSWVITNASGGAVKAAFFVVGEVDATKAPDLVLEDKTATGDPAASKKTVRLEITAKSGSATSTAKVLAAAPANTAKWFDATDTTSGIARITTIADNGTLEIKPVATTVKNNTNSAWNENDKFNLNFVFQFEFADATT